MTVLKRLGYTPVKPKKTFAFFDHRHRKHMLLWSVMFLAGFVALLFVLVYGSLHGK